MATCAYCGKHMESYYQYNSSSVCEGCYRKVKIENGTAGSVITRQEATEQAEKEAYCKYYNRKTGQVIWRDDVWKNERTGQWQYKDDLLAEVNRALHELEEHIGFRFSEYRTSFAWNGRAWAFTVPALFALRNSFGNTWASPDDFKPWKLVAQREGKSIEKVKWSSYTWNPDKPGEIAKAGKADRINTQKAAGSRNFFSRLFFTGKLSWLFWLFGLIAVWNWLKAIPPLTKRVDSLIVSLASYFSHFPFEYVANGLLIIMAVIVFLLLSLLLLRRIRMGTLARLLLYLAVLSAIIILLDIKMLVEPVVKYISFSSLAALFRK